MYFSTDPDTWNATAADHLSRREMLRRSGTGMGLLGLAGLLGDAGLLGSAAQAAPAVQSAAGWRRVIRHFLPTSTATSYHQGTKRG